MRIALVHNPKAGQGEIERDDIRLLLEARGHEVEEFGVKKHEVRRAIASGPDLIVVSGGDGTVGRAAVTCFLEGATMPFTVLPVGTANNIARSLGLDRSVIDLMDAWPGMEARPLDVGRIDFAGEREHFIEAAGVGFIGTMLRRTPSRARKLAWRVRDIVTRTDLDLRKAHGVARLIRGQELLPTAITADGADLGGDYVGIEAMNIREVGPNLCLAPTAHPGDGLLDLVLIRPNDRQALAERVHRRLTQSDPEPRVVRRVKCVELTWNPSCGHVDDSPWPAEEKGAGTATICIAGATPVLR